MGSQVSGTFQLGIRQLDNAPVESCKTLVDSITELATKAEFSVPWVASNKDDGSPEPEKVESKHEHPLDARTLHRRLMYVRDAGSPPPLHIVLKHAWIGRDPERFASGKLDLKGLLDGRQHRIELALEPDSSNAQQQVKKKKTSEKKQTSEGATEALDREQLPGVSLSLRLIPFSGKDLLFVCSCMVIVSCENNCHNSNLS